MHHNECNDDEYENEYVHVSYCTRGARRDVISERAERDGASKNKFLATLFSYERSELENKKYSCGAKNYVAPKLHTDSRLETTTKQAEQRSRSYGFY